MPFLNLSRHIVLLHASDGRRPDPQASDQMPKSAYMVKVRLHGFPGAAYDQLPPAYMAVDLDVLGKQIHKLRMHMNMNMSHVADYWRPPDTPRRFCTYP